MTTVEYVQGAELPDLTADWYVQGTLLDLTGHTFVVKVGTPGSAALFSKTDDITGAATSPNLTIAWDAADELSTLDPGLYTIEVTATRTADSKDRKRHISLRIAPSIT